MRISPSSLVALLLPGLLFGCASSSPHYYSLEREPGRSLHSLSLTVVVRSVSVARYLQRDEIVRKSQSGRVDTAENDWWSEPLRNMIQRVLAADLSQRLPDAEVLGTESLGDGGAAVVLAVDRFEPDGSGALLLDGHVAIQGRGQNGPPQRIAVSVALPAHGPDDQVEVMSRALGQVADTVAARIAGSSQ